MDTEADISDRISPMKLEVEDEEHNSGNSKIAPQELIGVVEKVESSFVPPLETIKSSASRENMQVENITDIADVHVVNEGIIKSIEGENFLKSPSGFDVEVDKNTEENQLNSQEKTSGSQNGDHIDTKTDENNAIPVSETTDCSKSTTLDIGKVRDICSLEEKRDDNLTTEATLSQQDSTETSFKGEDGSQNKISQSLLTEKEEDEVDKIEISKQESDRAAKDIVEDNLKDKPEALMTECEHEKLDTIVNEERGLKKTPEHGEPVLEQSFTHKNESTTENDEMLVIDACEEIEATPPRETPDQIPEKESETTTSGENKVFAIPEEKNLAAINLDEKNEAAEVAVTNKSGDDSDATSPLEEEEVQIISEKLNQVSKPETESQVLEVAEGPEGEQEGNSSNEVIQTEKHFDKIANDQIIQEEEFEEPNVTNKREKIEEDVKNETLPEHAREFNCEDMISYSQGNETDAKIGDKEEPNVLPEGPGNKIENDIEKSEDVSSLVTQALTEEIYDEKMEDTKNCVHKADTAPQRFAETTSLTEVEPIDKPLEEASIMKHLPEHEIEKGYREKVEHPDAQSESNVQAVQDVYEIPRSTNVEEHGAIEIEKIIREVPEEPYETSDQGAEADKNVEIPSHQTIQAEETEHQLPSSSSIFLSIEEDGESETKTQMEDKTGDEGSDAVSKSKDQKIEEMHETKTSTSAERNEEGSETNEDSEPTTKPSFHGIEEIKEIQSPIAGHIPTDEEKEELSPVPETGNAVNKLENEITDKTETEVTKPEANEVREENIFEIEPKVQSVDTIVEAESNPPAGETQAGKRNEEIKDVPETVSEPKAENVEEVSKTSIDVRSSKEDQFEKLNREAPGVFSKSTNQVVEAARNDDTVTPTVATEVISSKEFQLNDESENVTDSVSSAESTETAEKADSSLLDVGTEKNVLEDASAAVSDYGYEDEEKESESTEIHDKVEEARTLVTVSEYKDQVVEDARDTDLSSAGDESNINEISKVNQEVPEKLPVAINEDEESGSKVSPDQKIMKSDAEEVQEAKASEASIQSKAISVQEIDGFDPTHVVDKTRVNEEKEETEAVLESVPGINFQGVETILTEEVIPNQTLPIESKEQHMEPCSTLVKVKDQHHETTTEVEIVKSESIHKNDTRLNEDMAVLLEADTTQNVVHRGLEISNSDVTNQDTQNVATEKEIDEESIEEKTTCDEGTDIALRTGTEASLLGERELINDHINAFDTSLETTIPKTNETVDTSKQDTEVDDTKLEENSNVKSQLLTHENVSEASESKTAEKADAENLEAENSEVPAAESETSVHSVEENHETDTSQALGDTDASEEIDGFHPTPVVGKTPINKAKEETEAVLESIPEINFQGVGTIIDEEVSTSLTLPYENREQLTEPCSTLVEDPHHETATEVEMVKAGSINKNNTLLNEDTADSFETCTTGNVVPTELENSYLIVEDTENKATEKEIDEKSIEATTECDEETDIAATTETEVTFLGESELINDPINTSGTTSETTTPETIETIDTSEVDDIKLEEISIVESQLLAHENETEVCESIIATKTGAENVEVEKSEVPSAESETLVRNVEEIQETDTSPYVGDTKTSEIEEGKREVFGLTSQVYEADSSNEIAHGQKIQAENKIEQVPVPSFVFLSSEESPESEAIAIQNKEDGQMKKDDIEENNLKPQEDSGMVSQLQNIETVEETEADVIKFEESTGFAICESRTLLEEIQETKASPNAKNSGTDEREKETKSLAENVSASSTLNVEAVIDDEANERPLAIEESEEEHQESSSAILSKNKDETEESPETKTSNLLGVEEVHETETTADVEKTCADEVEEETKEALREIPEQCQDAGTIINREVLFNQNFPLEAIKSSKDRVEETDMAPIPASEVTDIGEIEVSEEAEKDLDISSDSKTPEAVETVDTCQRDSEVESIKTEEASIVESKPAEHENNKEAHGSIAGEKTDADDVKVENQKLLDAESDSTSVEDIHGAKGDPVVGETDTNKREKVVEEKPKALPGDIIQETSGMLSQVQNIETTKTSDADEVEAEEAKSFDTIYESKDHFDETLDTKTSQSAEISYEVKMEETTNNVAEKISDVEALADDVPADESTSVSKCPTENADIGADIKKSAADEPEAIVSELITESRVLDVEEIHETETSPTVGKINTDGEEDETKTVLETTYEPDHEDAADIIARYIISNQPFPHQNKEDIKKGAEETDILPAVVTEEGSMGENNPIDKVVNASGHSSDNETIQTADITKLDSEIPHETEKIAHQGIIQTVQEIHDINSTPTLGENDANGSVNVTDVEEAKRISSVVKPKDQAFEDICETGTSTTAGEAGTDGSDQEIRDAPETITEKINQNAAEVSKEEIALNQPIEAEKTKEQKDNGFDPIPESKDWIFEEARDTKTIPAAEIADKNKKEEYGTKVLEKISDDICTSDEAIVDGQTQSGTVFEPIYQAVGEIINKDINPNTIVQNECKKQLNEPWSELLKDQDEETFVKDGMIKAEGTDKNNASLNENIIDSSEAGTIVEKSSSKPVDEKCKEAFDLEFEKLGEVLQPESEILSSEVYSAPKVTDNVDEQLEEPAGNMRGYESETHIENTTEASQAIHEITSKEPLTEEPEKENNILKEPITADKSNIETPEQVSVGTRTVKVNYAEEEKNGTYVENEPITENEGKESEKLATESIRSIKEVKSLEVTLGKPEDKLGDYNEKDETAITNINNLENHVGKEKIENESHVPPCEKSGTKESVSIKEQEATANASDLPSSKTTSDEELADEGEIMVDQKQPNFVLDPLSIIPRTEEQVEKLVTVPTANNQEVIRDVTETNEIVKEPQEQEKIFLSLSQAQIARKEYPNEEKENTTAIANRDFHVIPEDPTTAKQVECFEERKQGEGTSETIEKMTQKDQTKQVTEEPKTEAEERALVEEEKTDEEEEHKKADSGSDAPVMVEASRDIDVKTPQKKSHNILSGVGSKVKHSIAKVKKAITGKSSHQKASSPKEDKKTEAVPLL